MEEPKKNPPYLEKLLQAKKARRELAQLAQEHRDSMMKPAGEIFRLLNDHSRIQEKIYCHAYKNFGDPTFSINLPLNEKWSDEERIALDTIGANFFAYLSKQGTN